MPACRFLSQTCPQAASSFRNRHVLSFNKLRSNLSHNKTLRSLVSYLVYLVCSLPSPSSFRMLMMAEHFCSELFFCPSPFLSFSAASWLHNIHPRLSWKRTAPNRNIFRVAFLFDCHYLIENDLHIFRCVPAWQVVAASYLSEATLIEYHVISSLSTTFLSFKSRIRQNHLRGFCPSEIN